jgi:hypothetical protein
MSFDRADGPAVPEPGDIGLIIPTGLFLMRGLRRVGRRA